MLPILAGILTAASVSAEPPDRAREAELDHLLAHDCGSCHGLTLKGGLGPPLLPENLKGRTREDLAAVVLHGLPGTPMPPWAGELSDADVAWIVDRLLTGRSQQR